MDMSSRRGDLERKALKGHMWCVTDYPGFVRIKESGEGGSDEHDDHLQRYHEFSVTSILPGPFTWFLPRIQSTGQHLLVQSVGGIKLRMLVDDMSCRQQP